jgi:hypothetical protein
MKEYRGSFLDNHPLQKRIWGNNEPNAGKDKGLLVGSGDKVSAWGWLIDFPVIGLFPWGRVIKTSTSLVWASLVIFR